MSDSDFVKMQKELLRRKNCRIIALEHVVEDYLSVRKKWKNKKVSIAEVEQEEAATIAEMVRLIKRKEGKKI